MKLPKISITKEHVKYWAADSTISLLYYTPIMGLSEFYIMDLNYSELVVTRSMGFLLSVTTAKPYTWIRNYVADKLNTTEESSKNRKYWTETLAAFIFYTPQYLATLYLSGAQGDAFYIGLGLSTSMVITSRIFGRVTDKFRSLVGLEGLLNDTKKHSS